MRRRGIFVKVFSYTAVFLILLVCVTVVLFSQQFLSFYDSARRTQLYESYQGLHELIKDKPIQEVLDIVAEYYENNQTFSFYVKDGAGRTIYHTPNLDPEVIDPPNDDGQRIIISVGRDYTIGAAAPLPTTDNYSDLISRSLLALGSMLAIGVFAAFLFARRMTGAIKRLADGTKKMANLEDAPPLPTRRDELGDLALDVHSMYDKLKETISRLEEEVLRERAMEEAQRYFFSAASHELKTPIAAASVLLEGMLENVGDYGNHPKYLRECIRMMEAEDKIISEILSVVRLDDGKIVPHPEKLDIGVAVGDLMPYFRTMAEGNGKLVSVDIPPGKICLADRKMLNRVLSNVLLNAVQNTPSGGEIRLWCEDVADQYRVCVHNSGAHIDEQTLPRLFDPFFRVDKARSRRDNRSGLGLTIVAKTLQAMGVDYSLENTAEGVLFRLDLPEI